MQKRFSLGALLCGLSLFAGCSVINDRKAEYETSKPEKTLETPPDLVSIEASDDLVSATAPVGGVAMLSDYNRDQGPQVKSMAEGAGPRADVGPHLGADLKLARDGGRWWLEAAGDPGEWWPKVKKFWEEQGLSLEKENPEIGLMTTQWREDRGGVPMSSVFRKAFSLLYSKSTRDQYVVRLEPATRENTTEIHIAHRGMQQINDGDTVRWVPREADPELEIEMLKRLALYAGADAGKADELALDAGTPKELAVVQFDDQGGVQLTLALDFPQAWRRVGNAMARLDVALDDFDRAKGVYYATGELEVEPTEQGWFKRFIAGGTRLETMEFRLVVESIDDTTSRVTMLDARGNSMDVKRAEAFFKRVREELLR